MIRFQNTGTAPAQDVYILDTISSLLDLNTFELLESSHSMNIQNLGNGVLRFNFPQIWLPDSTSNEPESHGHLVYRITENPGNGLGTEIRNTAYIFFDWNEEIITNTTYNINETLGLQTPEIISTIYPNPTDQFITVRSVNELQKVTLLDLSGKTLQQISDAGTEFILDLTAQPAGLYFLEVQTTNGTQRNRVVKK